MYNLKIEKLINREAKDVFKSLQQGKLFMNCSADSNSIQLDFKVGGKYHIDFKNHKVSNWGEFLEIIPNQKIVFTWCQTFGVDQKPDTKVTIELFPDGPKTRLVLEHSGFKDQAQCDNHYQGWNGGLNDLSNEMEQGSLRLVRRYETSIEALFVKVKSEIGNLLKNPIEFNEISPNQKMTFLWQGSQVTLNFLLREGNVSALEILQSKAQEDSRQTWDRVTNDLMELI